MTTIGHRIRVAQIYAGYKSADDLAADLDLPNLSAKTLRRTIAGERPAEAHELEAIARVCRVPVAFLMNDQWAPTASDDAHQLDRMERHLQEADSERAAMRELIARQNELLARQSVILERIEGLVGVLRGAEVIEAAEDAPATPELVRQAARILEAAVRSTQEGRQAEAPRDRPPPEDLQAG